MQNHASSVTKKREDTVSADTGMAHQERPAELEVELEAASDNDKGYVVDNTSSDSQLQATSLVSSIDLHSLPYELLSHIFKLATPPEFIRLVLSCYASRTLRSWALDPTVIRYQFKKTFGMSITLANDASLAECKNKIQEFILRWENKKIKLYSNFRMFTQKGEDYPRELSETIKPDRSFSSFSKPMPQSLVIGSNGYYDLPTLLSKLLTSHRSVTTKFYLNQWLKFGCEVGSLPLVRFLTENEVPYAVKEINDPAPLHDPTPLHFAAANGHTDIIRLLIKQFGKDIINEKAIISFKIKLFNQTWTGRATPLDWATYNKQNQAVALLLEMGADVNAKHRRGETLLQIACKFSSRQVIKTLLKYDPTVDQDTGKQLLVRAAKDGDFILAQLCLPYVKELNSLFNRASLLGAACEYGHQRIAQLYLDHGADVNFKDSQAKPPLYHAIHSGNIRLVKFLIERGANLSDNAFCPLHDASMFADAAMVRLFLDHGFDVNKLHEGWTPLHAAAHNGNVEVVKLLLSCGANTNIKADDGSLPLHEAAYLSWGGPPERFVTTIKILLEHDNGVNVYATNDSYGKTPLHIAASNGNIGVVTVLLDYHKRDKIDVLDLAGNSPLKQIVISDSAPSKSDIAVVKTLLDAGADPMLPDENGMTLLHHAVENRTASRKIPKLLLDYGANPNFKNNAGHTASDLARIECRKYAYRKFDVLEKRFKALQKLLLPREPEPQDELETHELYRPKL